MTRDTVWFFWRFTRPLSRLILPAPGAGAGGAWGAGGVWGTGGADTGCCGAAVGWAGVGWAGSSTVTPKSVAMPASPFAYPWPTARAFHWPLRR